LKEIDALQHEGKTVVLVSSDQETAGLIALADTIRGESAQMIADLKNLRVKTAMLTGDHETAAKAVAEELGIDEVHADLLPDGKVDALRAMLDRYGVVGMVGDGVNDSPALATSSVGISMSSLGSDVAIEAADIVLLSDRLSLIPKMVSLGRRASGIIQINTFFAILVKLIFVTLALLGKGSLALAIFADVGVTLLVILNALRLLKS